MTTAPAALAPPIRSAAEFGRFLNWLACWVVLPNLPFLPVTLMGGPPRYSEILVCGIVGLLARGMPPWLRRIAFVALLSFLVVTFIGRMFNMAPTMILLVAPLLLDIRPAVSTEYVVGGILVAACAGAGLWLLRSAQDFAGRKWSLWAVASVLTLAGFDYAMSKGTMGAYDRVAPDDAPFASAVGQTGLLELADGKTNLMVVMVEAMGQPTDPRVRARLERIWLRPEFSKRFDVSHGETPFYGSTTSGELRELCGRWGAYQDIVAPEPGCLPAMLRARGYRTTSYHAFTADFFDRERWYPLLGFDRSIFGPEMTARGAAFCPNVFGGACDRDVPRLIGEQLRHGEDPQFIYWLTLNSHLPIIEDEQLGTSACRQLGGRRDDDFPMICRILTLWEDTADALAQLVTTPDFPPTDILIVGDHMPPFTHQKSRLQFDSEKVPWILLKHREAGRAPAAAAAQERLARSAT